MTSLQQAVTDAETTSEILAALACLIWAADHDGADCPPVRKPTPEAVATWLSDCPEAVCFEANGLYTLTMVAAFLAYRELDGDIGRFADSFRKMGLVASQLMSFLLEDEVRLTPQHASVGIAAIASRTSVEDWTANLEFVHRVWLIARHNISTLKHPFAPLVRAYLATPLPSKIFAPVNRASLPRLDRVKESHLPDLSPALRHDIPHQPWLPTLELSLAPCPSWLLWLFDQCGGRELSGTKGASWPFRLFIYAFLHLHIHDRDGNWRSRRFPQEEVIGWLHPNGWTNRRRDFDRFPDALRTINERLATLPVGKGWLHLIGTSYSPKHEAVEFNLRLPPVAAHGAPVDWPALRKSGTVSDGRLRAHLAAAAFLDRSARKGSGITAEIGKALRHDTGQPKRRKGGIIIRSATELEANPAARFVRPLSDRDLANMIRRDPDNRQHRLKARRDFEALHAEGVIDLRADNRGVRIFEPRKLLVRSE